MSRKISNKKKIQPLPNIRLFEKNTYIRKVKELFGDNPIYNSVDTTLSLEDFLNKSTSRPSKKNLYTIVILKKKDTVVWNLNPPTEKIDPEEIYFTYQDIVFPIATHIQLYQQHLDKICPDILTCDNPCQYLQLKDYLNDIDFPITIVDLKSIRIYNDPNFFWLTLEDIHQLTTSSKINIRSKHIVTQENIDLIQWDYYTKSLSELNYHSIIHVTQRKIEEYKKKYRTQCQSTYTTHFGEDYKHKYIELLNQISPTLLTLPNSINGLSLNDYIMDINTDIKSLGNIRYFYVNKSIGWIKQSDLKNINTLIQLNLIDELSFNHLFQDISLDVIKQSYAFLLLNVKPYSLKNHYLEILGEICPKFLETIHPIKGITLYQYLQRNTSSLSILSSIRFIYKSPFFFWLTTQEIEQSSFKDYLKVNIIDSFNFKSLLKSINLDETKETYKELCYNNKNNIHHTSIYNSFWDYRKNYNQLNSQSLLDTNKLNDYIMPFYKNLYIPKDIHLEMGPSQFNTYTLREHLTSKTILNLLFTNHEQKLLPTKINKNDITIPHIWFHKATLSESKECIFVFYINTNYYYVHLDNSTFLELYSLTKKSTQPPEDPIYDIDEIKIGGKKHQKGIRDSNSVLDKAPLPIKRVRYSLK